MHLINYCRMRIALLGCVVCVPHAHKRDIQTHVTYRFSAQHTLHTYIKNLHFLNE